MGPNELFPIMSSIRSKYTKIRFELRSRYEITTITSIYTKELAIKSITNKGLCGDIGYKLLVTDTYSYNFGNDSRFKDYYVVEIKTVENKELRINDDGAYYYVMYFYK